MTIYGREWIGLNAGVDNLPMSPAPRMLVIKSSTFSTKSNRGQTGCGEFRVRMLIRAGSCLERLMLLWESCLLNHGSNNVSLVSPLPVILR
jgi:hypothetical protein